MSAKPAIFSMCTTLHASVLFKSLVFFNLKWFPAPLIIYLDSTHSSQSHSRKSNNFLTSLGKLSHFPMRYPEQTLYSLCNSTTYLYEKWWLSKLCSTFLLRANGLSCLFLQFHQCAMTGNCKSIGYILAEWTNEWVIIQSETLKTV